jgi:hypothetical protein
MSVRSKTDKLCGWRLEPPFGFQTDFKTILRHKLWVLGHIDIGGEFKNRVRTLQREVKITLSFTIRHQYQCIQEPNYSRKTPSYLAKHNVSKVLGKLQ